MLILRPVARFRAPVICLAITASRLLAPQAMAVEPIPDYKTLVFPSIIRKAGSTDPAANSDPGTIRNNYENYYENFWKDVSYFSYDPVTGQKEQGFYIDTKTYGYVHMPWPINQTTNVPLNTYTGPRNRNVVMGLGEPFADGDRRYSQNLEDLGLLTTDLADQDGFWTPGESFRDANGNSQYDPYRPAEDYWNNDNTAAILQRRNAGGGATGNLSAPHLSGGPYRGPVDNNNNWNNTAGELYADYNEDTDLTNDAIGYDTNVVVYIANGANQTALTLNELDLSPADATTINEGDFAHTIVADAAHLVGPTPTNVPRNGVFDFTTNNAGIPQVRRVTYRNGSLLWVQYDSYVRTNATAEAANPVVYRYADVRKIVGAPPAGFAVRTVRAPVYQTGELYSRPQGNASFAPANEYGDLPAGNNNANLWPNTRQVLSDNTWTPRRDAELFEDYLVFGGPNARYRNDIDPGPPGGNALDPQRPGRGTTNGPRNSITQAEYEAYIRWNYSQLGATNAFGVVTGIVDTISYVGGVITNVANGVADNIDALIARADNGQYDGPENWTEEQTTKVTFAGVPGLSTEEPGSFFAQNWAGAAFGYPTWQSWWADAFNTTNMPPWNGIVANANVYAPSIAPDGNGWIPADSWAYDSNREFCDMPSSLYHIGGDATAVTAANYYPRFGFLRTDPAGAGGRMGDNWIGEITSPWSRAIYGQDVGPDFGLDFVGPGESDSLILPAGPFCVNAHGNNGHDAGNVLPFEVMSRRTDSDRTTDPNYPEDLRDVNLDGFFDMGNSRVGDVNYAGRPNGDGSGGYPFNRMRYMEDLIEMWDSAEDFNTFPLVNPVTGLPFLYGYGIYEQTENLGSGALGGPAGATTTFYTRDRVDPIDILFQIRPIEGGELDGEIPTGTGVIVSNQVNGANFGMGILCHEQGHDLLNYPDLYDYDVWNGRDATLNRPIGSYDLMSGGGLVHGIPDFKVGFGAGWATPVNLTSLVPLNGGPTVVELYPAEDYGQNSYFFYLNPSNNFEYMYFYYYGANSPYAPTAGGPGVYITHTDLDSNPNGVPNQQRINNHFTWEVIQADGFYHLADGVNAGDAGDPFPGATSKFIFTEDTTPAARWWDQREAGIRILDIALPTVLGEPALVTFERFNNAVASPIVPTAGNDLDNDGMPDAWEVHYWGNTTTSNGTGDFDFDDLTDLGEFLAGTSPIDSDTDNDNVPDGQEDADADGIANQDEIDVTNTHPGLVDSDDDGWLDGNELNAAMLSGDRLLTSPAHSVSPLIERCLFFNGTAIPVPPSVLPSQPDRFDNQAASWTLEAWINPAGLETGSIIRRRTNTGFVSFELRLDNNVPSVRFTTLANGIVQAGGTVAIPSGEWTHLAGVWNNANDTLSLYVNGVSYRSQTSLFSPAQGRGGVVLGDGITGSVDEVRIWQTARTAAQIEAFSHSIVGSPLQNAANQLIAYYRFDDGGDLAEDFMHPITVGAANVNNFRYALDGVTFDNTDCVKFCQIDDFNANGMADWYENLFFGYAPPTLPGPSGAADADSDGLTNLFEYHADSNPKDTDSDNDGTPDSSEDRDTDGLSNALEQGLGSSPVLRDTDDDGLSDNLEAGVFQSATSSSSPLIDRVLQVNGSAGTFLELARNSESRLTNTTWTVEAWVNPTALAGDGEIIARQVEANKFQYRLQVLASGQIRISYSPDNGGADEQLASTQVLPVSEWHHVAAMYNRSSPGTGVLSIQVDGVQWANRTVSTTPARNGVGPLVARVGQGFNGQIDEVRLWNAIPAARTIEELRAPIASVATNLMVNLRFDDGTNPTGTSANASWLTGQVEDFTNPADWTNCWAHAATLRGAAQIVAPANGGGLVASQLDTDRDGIPDGWEIQYGLDPRTANTNVDTDADGLTDYSEYQAGTNPRLTDTDNNGVGDAFHDSDNDGLANTEEQDLGTNPGNADSDDDGVSDGDELNASLAKADGRRLTSPLASESPEIGRSFDLQGTSWVVPETGQVVDSTTGLFRTIAGAYSNLVSWTVEVWVKPASGGETGSIVSRRTSAGLYNFDLRLDGNVPSIRYQTLSGIYKSAGGTQSIPAGEWTHLAASYDDDADTITLLVNGISHRAQTSAVPPARGRGSTFLGSTINGLVDNLRIWANAVPAETIARLRDEFLYTDGRKAFGDLPNGDGAQFTPETAWVKAIVEHNPGSAPEGNLLALPASIIGEADGQSLSMGLSSAFIDDNIPNFVNLLPFPFPRGVLFRGEDNGGWVKLDMGDQQNLPLDQQLRAKGDSRADLFVFERLSRQEPVVVLVSVDGDSWHYAGITAGGTSGVDLDGASLAPVLFARDIFGELYYGSSLDLGDALLANDPIRSSAFRYVWLVAATDVIFSNLVGTFITWNLQENVSTLGVPGPDIDAVGIPNYGSAIPVAWYPFDDGGTTLSSSGPGAENYTRKGQLSWQIVGSGPFAPVFSADTAPVRGVLDYDGDQVPEWWTDLFFSGRPFQAVPLTVISTNGTGQAVIADDADDDDDQLNNLYEYWSDTNPLSADTDNDGIPDQSEDRDTDGLSNALEQGLGTSPVLADTDDDGFSDNAEAGAFHSAISSLSPLTDRVLVVDGTAGTFLELARNSESVLSPSNWTVEAWVNAASLGADGEIIARQVEANKFQYRLQMLATGQIRISYTPDNGGALEQLTTTQAIAVSEWHHVAAFYSRSAPGTGILSIQVDGIQWANRTVSTTPARNGVGPLVARVGLGFSGEIDEVRLWSTNPPPRTLAELRTPIAVVPSTLPVYFRFDDGTNASGTSGNAAWLTGQVEDYSNPADWANSWSHAGTLRGSAVLATPSVGGGLASSLLDTDGDGMPNGWEVQYGLNPANASDGVNGANDDIDGDGLSNLLEYQAGTNPRLTDTDNDGRLDGDEDSDGDTLSNLEEQNFYRTNPGLADTDDDGVNDDVEVNVLIAKADGRHITSPLASDSPAVGRSLQLTGTEYEIPETGWNLDQGVGLNILVSDRLATATNSTFEIWVKPATAAETGSLLRRVTRAGLTSFELRLDANVPSLRIQTKTGAFHTVGGSVAIPANEWTYLAATINSDAHSLSLLVNGVAYRGINTFGVQATGIGRTYLGGGITGLVDNLRVWDVAQPVSFLEQNGTIFHVLSGGSPNAVAGLPGVNFIESESWAKQVMRVSLGPAPETNNFTVANEVLGPPDGNFLSLGQSTLLDINFGFGGFFFPTIVTGRVFNSGFGGNTAAGYIILDMGDPNLLAKSKRLHANGDSRPDLYVIERLSEREAVSVLVSNDGDAWYYVGDTQGGSSGVDLDSAPFSRLQAESVNNAVAWYAYSLDPVDFAPTNALVRSADFRYVWLVAKTEDDSTELASLSVPGPDIDAVGVPYYANVNPLAWYPFDDGENAASPSLQRGAEDYSRPMARDFNIRAPAGGTLSFSNDHAPVRGVRDSDGDSIPDWWGNMFFGLNVAFESVPLITTTTNGFGQLLVISDADDDKDGLHNLYEYLADTNPKDVDADNDGILDRSEDPDLDGLSNLREQERSAHPGLADSDDDGILDGLEVAQLTNPALSSSPLIGRALNLTGAAGQFLEMPYSNKYALTNLTVEAWIRVNSLGTAGSILSRQVATNAYNYRLSVLPSGQIEFRFTREDRSGDEVLVSGTTIQPGVWTHVAGMIGQLAGSRRMRVQMDGINVADRLTDALPASNGVGPLWTRAGEGFAGQLDDLRIYSAPQDTRALNTLRQVVPGTSTNLVAYFRFDDSTNPSGTSRVATWNFGQVEDFTTTANWMQHWHLAASLRGGATVTAPNGSGGVNAEFSDLDADNLPDAWEANNGLDPTLNDAALDPDGDGLSNAYEYQSGTNPNLVDSDLDGVGDALEDSDGDGLTNADEQNFHVTDAGQPDSDDDGISDRQEVDQATDPNESLDPFVIRQICNDGSGVMIAPGTDDLDSDITGTRLNLANFTVETMVRLDRLPSSSGQNVVLVSRAVKPSGYLNYELGIDITDRPYVRFHDSAGNEYRVTGNAPIPLNEWTHLAGRFGLDAKVNSTQLAIIYNHVSLARDLTNTRPATGEQMGGLVMADNLFGCVDEVRIWEVARSDQEIDNLIGKSLLFGFDSAGAASLLPNTTGRMTGIPLNLATNWTVSAWVRGTGDGEIAYVQAGTADDGETIYNFRIRVVNGLTVANFDFNADLLFREPPPVFFACRPRWGTVTLNSDIPVNDGNWHFVTMTFERGNAIDSGVARLIVDDREVDAVRFLPNFSQVIWHLDPADNPNDLLGYCTDIFIFNSDFNSMAAGGNLPLQVGVRYGGAIDEVAVYNQHRSFTNVVQRRTFKHEPADPTLLAYYDFDNVEANDEKVNNKVNDLPTGILVDPARLSLGRGSNAPLSIRPVDILKELLVAYYPMEDGRYLGAMGTRTNGIQAVEDFVHEGDMRFAATLSNVNNIDFTAPLINQVATAPSTIPVFFPVPFDSPYRIDSDGDGMPDVFEQYFNLDPNLDINVIIPRLGSLEDRDEDGLINLYEYYAGTDPTFHDTDGDGVSDIDEDGDNDGLTNGDEQAIGSNPGRMDSDDDGYNDLLETHPELSGRPFATNPADSSDYFSPLGLTGVDCRSRQKYMVLDGADHVLPTPPTDRRRFNAGSWTVEGTVLLDNAGSSGSIFRYVGQSYPNPGGAPVSHTFYQLGVTNGLPFVRMQGTATFTLSPVQMGALPAGRWVHLAAVFDDAKDFLGLYVDGTLAAQRLVIGSGLAGSTTAYNFPGRAIVGSAGYTGALDDLRVWNYARSQAQIRAGMEKQVQAWESGQIAHFRFDDGRARDAAGVEIADGYSTSAGMGAEDYVHRPLYEDQEEGWQYALRGITFGCALLDCPRTTGFEDRDQDGLADGYEDLYFQADVPYYRPIFDSTDQIVDDTQLSQHVSGSDTASFSALDLGWNIDFTPMYTLPGRRLSRSPDNTYLFKDVSLEALTDKIEIRMANPVGGRLFVNGVEVTNVVGAAQGTFVYNPDPNIVLTQTYYYPPASLTNLFVVGRNRISVEVVNRNGVLPYEYFSLELFVNSNTYLIRRGDDNAKETIDSAMWFEFARVGSTAEPPLDRRGRRWFTKDYATDASDDLDNDGLTSLQESIVRTNPKTADTDADGVSDGHEDFDGDGLNNLVEESHGSDPRLIDTDDDGLSDFAEDQIGSNPADSLSPVKDRVLEVDGTAASHVELADHTRFALSTWSLEAWIHPRTLTDAGILSREIQAGRFNWSLSLTAAGTIRALFTASDLSGDVVLESPVCVTAGEWTHVAAAFNAASGRLSISVDGIVLANTAVSAGRRPATGALGFHGALIGAGFDGYIDDVRIWSTFRENMGLAAFEVPLNGNESGLVGYYRFDDDTHAAGTSATAGWNCHQVQDHASLYAADWSTYWSHAGSLKGNADIVPSPAESPLSAELADSDGDGLPDGWESENGLNPFSAAGLHGGQGDADGDGLSNYGEYLSGTHPWLKDTDADGVNDAFDDTDADGLTNLAEVRDHNTLPTQADTDDDGFSDYQEVTGLVASNPRGASSPVNSMDPARRQSICLTGNGRVEIPDQTRHNLAAWTIQAWVNPLPGAEGIVVRRQVFTQSQLNKLNGINYELGVYNDAGTPRAYAQYAGLTAAAPASITPVRVDCHQPQEIPGDGFTRAVIRPNTWTHLAAVYDPVTTSLRLYVNGELVTYRSDAFPPFGLGTQGELVVRGLTTIGGGSLSSPGVAADGFEGCIDDVMILPRASSTLDVQAFAHVNSIEQSAFVTAQTTGSTSSSPAQNASAMLANPHVPNQLLVKFKANSTEQDRDAAVTAWGSNTLRSLKRMPFRTVSVPQGMTIEQAFALIQASGVVEYVQPNYLKQVFRVPNDTRFGEMWGLHNSGQVGQYTNTPGRVDADIDAPEAWELSTGSHAILVSVNDTGIDVTHPDLAANIWTNPGEIANNGVDDDGNGYVDDIHGWDFFENDNNVHDDSGHGTHVAGTIGAVGNNGIGVAGVNWNVRLMALRVGNDTGLPTAAIIEAIEYSVLNGAKVSNHSYGGFFSDPAELDAFRFAQTFNHLMVVAAGNFALDNDNLPGFLDTVAPTNYDLPKMISVAAMDRFDQLTYFSHFGATSVDLAAPGEEILSTWPGATYKAIDGTSMASPHVAGAAALVLSRAPALPVEAVKNILLSTVRPIPSMQGLIVTGGALNLAAALRVVAPVGYYTFDEGGVTVEDFTVSQDWTNQWEHAGIRLNASFSTNTYLGLEVDTDGDSMPDWWELANGLDPNNAGGTNGAEADVDRDGISNLTEYFSGTHPWLRDSDQDGVLDNLEDNDMDGITAIDEQNFSLTHSGLRDTDDDGLDDKFEVVTGTLPIDSLSPAFNRFVKLDGAAGTYVEYPNQPRFNLTSWTIDMMIKVSALPSTNAVLFARNLLRKNDLTNFNYNLSLTPSGKVVGGFTGTTGTDVAIQSPTALPLGVWTWVSLAFNEQTGRLSVLIDGRVAAAITTPERPMTSLWGEAYILAGSGFNGCIDEIRVWNNDHSTLVQAMPLDRPLGTEPNLVAWSLFDDSTAMGGVSGRSTLIKGQVEDFVYRSDWINGWQHAASLVGNAQILKSGTSFGLGADCAIDSFLDLGAYPWQTGAYNNRRGTVLTDPRKYHFCQSTVVYSGKTAVQAGGINTAVNPAKFALGDNETSWLRTSVVGPGRICFQWKCEIEPPAFVGNEADYYTFFVDGAQRALITGSVDWTNQCAEIAAGVHSLSWQFSKDRFGAWPTNLNAAIKDSVFLDAVNFVHTGPDTDGDGLPDAYETLSTLPAPLGRTNPNLADTDGDGINDGDEISLGLNPLVSNVPVINSMSMVNGRLTINWTGTAGLRYLVQKSYNLTTWVNAPNGFLPNEISQVVAPVTGPLQYRDPQSPEAGSPSYRVLVIP